jgi:predicted restriction endonuclease
MERTEIFPVGIHADESRANFDRRVLGQVPHSKYDQHTDQDLGDQARIWGYRDKGKGTWRQLSEGDYLLFYPGNKTYKYAARISGKEHNPDLGSALFETPDEPFEYVVFLDSLYHISLDSEVLHEEYAGYKIGHPVKSQSFNDRAYKEILSRYESVEKYIEAHLKDPSVSLPSKSEGSSSTSGHAASADPDERAGDLKPPKKEYTVSRTIRNTTIAKEVKELHDHRCQVCGDRRERDDSGYAEAHHIHPLGAEPPGPDQKQNILILCPNHHADFDFGMLSVDPETLEIEHHYDEAVNGNTLTTQSGHEIDPEHLQYHNENS